MAKERLTAELIPAAARDDRKSLAHLLKVGADANAAVPGDDDDTPLAWATRCAKPSTVEYLIDHGADVNKRFDDLVFVVSGGLTCSLYVQ